MSDFKCCVITWNEAHKLIRNLAHKIKKSNFEPDIVIGIARGGLVPGRIICDFLFKKELAFITVAHWDTAKTIGKATIKSHLTIDITGKKVLLIDDVADMGDTFIESVKYLNEKSPSEIKTASLHYKTSSKFIPDYWGEKQEDWKWIIYPWAIYEDIIELIKNILEYPMTSDAIRKNLKTKYDINIQRKQIFELLNDSKFKCIKKGKKKLWVKHE